MANSIVPLFRRLVRSPGFSAVTVLTLAIGIGATAALFGVVNGVLLKPLPYPEPERLVGVWQTAPGLNIGQVNASPSTYFTYREESRTFADIGVWNSGSASVTGLAEPEQIPALYVSDGLLPILGVAPLHGRLFSREDDRPKAAGTVILTHGYWRRRFGSDARAVGRVLRIDGDSYTIIGVMPAHFRFLDLQASLILPMRFDRGKAFVGNFSYQAVARLKPGVTMAQANDDVARMLGMLTSKFPVAPGLNLKMIEEARLGPDVHALEEDVIGDIGRVLWVLMGAASLLLLIACASVANLMLVRTEARQQELAVRAALGASWARQARELLTESGGLGLAAGVIGTGVAYAALRALAALAPSGLPRIEEISFGPAELLFILAISAASGLLFGLIPVIKYAATPMLNDHLRQGGRTQSQGRERHRARNLLVVTQVALALMLLIGAGLMIRTIQAMTRVDPGFTDPAGILTLRIAITGKQAPEPERVVRMQNDIVDRLRALPGVTDASLGNSVTMDGNMSADPIFAEDKTYSEGTIPPIRRFKFVGPEYFRTMGNRLVAGRDFNWIETHTRRPVVILNEKLARELWQRPEAAIGKRVRESPKGIWREVIGVAGNEHDDGAHRPAPAIVYWPLAVGRIWDQEVAVRRNAAFVIRSPRAGSSAFLREVEKAIWAVNPELPLASVRTMQSIYSSSMSRTSLTLTIMAIAGGMALLLGVIGIYGVISYSVTQRTREIGIRMALGAAESQVRRMFLREGLVLAGVGVVCGLAAAYGAARLMSSLLFGVQPVDPLTYVLVPAGLAAAAALASYVPARRAAAMAPVAALRAE